MSLGFLYLYLFVLFCVSMSVSSSFHSSISDYQIIHNCTNILGVLPFNTLIYNAFDSNLYGIMNRGGASNWWGTVFQLNPLTYKYSVLHDFMGARDTPVTPAALTDPTDISRNFDGGNPVKLIISPSFVLYGSTSYGGSFNYGTIYRLNPAAAADNITWYSIIYQFSGKYYDDAQHPASIIISRKDGNLYGLAAYDNQKYPQVKSILFKIAENTPAAAPDRYNYNYTIIYKFTFDIEGFRDSALLESASDDNLYIAMVDGGKYGSGTILCIKNVFESNYEISVSILHIFSGYPYDGQSPQSLIERKSDGNLFGVTFTGGEFNVGSVFKLSKSGEFTLLHSFKGPDMWEPIAPLIEIADSGNFLGVSQGMYGGGIYSISTDGNFTLLHPFNSSVDGWDASAGLTPLPNNNDTNGVYYFGATSRGPADGWGSIFSMKLQYN